MATPIGAVLEQVRERLPLADVLAKHRYTLRPSGRNRMVTLCPFHADRRRPNLVIYIDEQRFHCFCCGARGDVVDLVQFLDRHNDFVTALRALTDELHIAWPGDRPAAADDTRSVLTLATRIYAAELTGEALAYLAHRGFPEAFVRKWRIGYAPPNDPQFLRNRLKEEGIAPDAAFAAGVVTSPKGGSGLVRDFFASGGGGYLILPNPGLRGTIVDLQGRAYPEHDGKPKYLNLPRGRRHLFNEATLPQAEVVLTEGIPDALSCLLAGIPAVAVYGTSSFSDKFIPRFGRCRRVYVAFDLDVHDRSIEVAMAFGLRGRVLMLPSSLGQKGDLNDLLVQLGPEQFRMQLERLRASAETGYAMTINRLPDDLHVTDLFEAAAPLLAAIGALDPVSRDAHLHLLHVKYGVGMDTLRDAAREALMVVPSSGVENGPTLRSAVSVQERDLSKSPSVVSVTPEIVG